MPNESSRREGYLVLADISGYTAFLTGTELEHAQGIIEELTTLIHDRLVPPLHFVKLEGDAVFCYADGFEFNDGERLLEVLEVCYCDFADRLFDMARSSTCGCAACAAIDTLDLKFVAHFGTYMVQQLAGVQDLAGPDVILLHRLLKNSITEGTGCRAYAFFTEPCLQRLPASLNLPKHAETYESFGETTGGVHDLKPVLAEMRQERREYVSAADADIESTFEVPVPPPVLWQYWVDPDKSVRWLTKADPFVAKGRETTSDLVFGHRNAPNSRGRLGVGAIAHCEHGASDMLHRYVDWRPFKYFTRELAPIKRSFFRPPMTETAEFVPRDDGGTVCHYRIRFQNRGRLFQLGVRLLAPVIRRQFRSSQTSLRKLCEEEELLRQSAPEQPADLGKHQP